METTVIKSGEFYAVLPKHHPLAEKKSLILEDFAKEPFLLLEEGVYSEPLEAFHAAGITPNIKLRVHDDYSILSMVEQGLGASKSMLTGFVKYLPSACMDCTVPRFTVSCSRYAASHDLLRFGYISSDSVKCKVAPCVQGIEYAAQNRQKRNKYPPAKPGVFIMRAKPYVTSHASCGVGTTCHLHRLSSPYWYNSVTFSFSYSCHS